MVAQQKIKDSSSASECSDNGSGKGNPGSPKSRLAMLKRSSAKSKTAVAANDPFRFQGNGVDFKGKLIGEREVKEARGDDMCAEAMRLAKAEIKAAGKHKPRIVLNISIEGLKIKDEKTSAILYSFPVSKISFIARDTTDARAFGFIFGTPDAKYKFYGIKTAQTADHAVLSIRDMFQVVFEMKKKQIEEAKQKKEEQENQEREENGTRMEGGVPVADLLDLETELQTIQNVAEQSIVSMPEDSWSQQPQQNGADIFQSAPFNGSSPTSGVSDPFGDSFTIPLQQQAIHHVPVGQVVWPGYANALNNLQNGVSAPAPAANGFNSTNPFMQTATSPQIGVAMPTHTVDPFNTESARRVISANQTTHSFGLPPPPSNGHAANGHGTNGINGNVHHQMPEINWSPSSLKENTAPIATNGFSHFANNTSSAYDPKRVTTLEDAFSKLVDMDALVQPGNTVPTRKNPFEHIINPPKMPLAALAAAKPQPTPVMPTARSDPFADDFFN